MNKKVCSVLKFCISMIMALFSIFTLFFSLWKVAGSSENGFDFLNFCSLFSSLGAESASLTNEMKSYSVLVGIILWLQILFSLIYISILLILLFKKIYKKQTTYENSIYNLNIICVTFSVIYMILGIACRKGIANVLITSGMEFGVESLVSTLSYIPLIISAVLLIFYVVVCLLEYLEIKDIKNNIKPTVVSNESNVTITKEKTLNDDEKIALLSKYHELVEKNILSQEDFEHKKKELLGL